MKGLHYRFTDGALIEEADDGWVYAYSLFSTRRDLFGFGGFGVWAWRRDAPGRPFKHVPTWRLLDHTGRLAIWIDDWAAVRYPAFGKFLNFIPLQLKMFAGLFEPGDQWTVLELLSNQRQFSEAAINSPEYTWLAISLSGALSKPQKARKKAVHDIATRPRAEVLGGLAGLKITKGQLKALNRLERDCLCPESASHLLSVLACPEKSRALQHCKKITPDYLEDLAEIPFSLVTGHVAKFLSDEESVRRVVRCGQLLRVRHDKQAGGEFRHSLARVTTRQQFYHLVTQAPFLLPPFKGAGSLIPLRSPRQLKKVGRNLGLCLGHDQARLVNEAFAYYFFWNEPEEPVAVEFFRRDNWEEGEDEEEWAFSQARGRDNALPSNETLFEILKAVVGGGESVRDIKNKKPGVKPSATFAQGQR